MSPYGFAAHGMKFCGKADLLGPLRCKPMRLYAEPLEPTRGTANPLARFDFFDLDGTVWLTMPRRVLEVEPAKYSEGDVPGRFHVSEPRLSQSTHGRSFQLSRTTAARIARAYLAPGCTAGSSP